MEDSQFKTIPIKFMGSEYSLHIETLPGGRLNQYLLDSKGDVMASFFVPEEVTEDQCRWFLSGHSDGYRKGVVEGDGLARKRIVRALLRLPTSLTGENDLP